MESTTMSKHKQLHHRFSLRQGKQIQNYMVATEYATKELR